MQMAVVTRACLTRMPCAARLSMCGVRTTPLPAAPIESRRMSSITSTTTFIGPVGDCEASLGREESAAAATRTSAVYRIRALSSHGRRGTWHRRATSDRSTRMSDASGRGMLSRREWLAGAAALIGGARASGQVKDPIDTVTGPIAADRLGLTLMHEHVLVDFIGADRVSPGRYDADHAFATVLPHLKQVRALG